MFVVGERAARRGLGEKGWRRTPSTIFLLNTPETF